MLFGELDVPNYQAEVKIITRENFREFVGLW